MRVQVDEARQKMPSCNIEERFGGQHGRAHMLMMYGLSTWQILQQVPKSKAAERQDQEGAIGNVGKQRQF